MVKKTTLQGRRKRIFRNVVTCSCLPIKSSDRDSHDSLEKLDNGKLRSEDSGSGHGSPVKQMYTKKPPRRRRFVIRRRGSVYCNDERLDDDHDAQEEMELPVTSSTTQSSQKQYGTGAFDRRTT